VSATDVLLRAEGVTKAFPVRSGGLRHSRDVVHAVDGVSLDVRRGETLGLVGETGCGKSTLARCMARLYDLTDGSLWFDGTDISRLGRRQMRPLRSDVQMIFQDPYGSATRSPSTGSARRRSARPGCSS
jgi:ABC-type oligopeptide transport system ATPase subunit